MTAASIFAALLFVGVHCFAPHMRFVSRIPRSRWLSAAGGASVAYVFLHLLPEVAKAQATLEQSVTGPLAAIDRHAHLLALAGLAVFYGLERATLRSRGARDQRAGAGGRNVEAGGRRLDDERDATDPRASTGAFVLSIASFTTYNVLLGYVVVRTERTAAAQTLYAIAIALHFAVNDVGLRDHHKELYDHVGRWILALAVISGVALGYAVRVPESVVVGTLAFLAGGIVLNVLKEELPAERNSRFWAFAIGATAYAALLTGVSAIS